MATDESRSAALRHDGEVVWSFSLRPASWGIWLDRTTARQFFDWRLNIGPLHIVKIAGYGDA